MNGQIDAGDIVLLSYLPTGIYYIFIRSKNLWHSFVCQIMCMTSLYLYILYTTRGSKYGLYFYFLSSIYALFSFMISFLIFERRKVNKGIEFKNITIRDFFIFIFPLFIFLYNILCFFYFEFFSTTYYYLTLIALIIYLSIASKINTKNHK
jgi:hypothetical protein